MQQPTDDELFSEGVDAPIATKDIAQLPLSAARTHRKSVRNLALELAAKSESRRLEPLTRIDIAPLTRELETSARPDLLDAILRACPTQLELTPTAANAEHQQVDTTTRIDVDAAASAKATSRDPLAPRLSLKLFAACRGMSLSLVFLLLCLPVALWGAVLAYTLRPEWTQTLAPAFRLFMPVYTTAIAFVGAVGGWRAARELCLAVCVLMIASYVVAVLS
jgi:hypothetical protein